MINRAELENLDDTGYYHYVEKFCRSTVFSREFNGKLSSGQLKDAEFLMRNGIGRVEKGSGSHQLQGAISKLQLLIIVGRPLLADVPDWVYGWKQD